MTDVPDLARTAHDTDAVVIGGGIAGLVAAYRLAEIGIAVTLLESSDALGGSMRTVTVGGHTADLVASSFVADEHFEDLLRDLGLNDATTPVATARRTTLAGGDVRPLPDGLLGIPASPFAPEVVGVIGWGGAWRAYLDRLRPVLTIGHQKNLGTLVRSRLGRKVAERLVGPVARATYGIGIDDIDVDAAAPTLNASLTRMGSLTGAVADVSSDETPAHVFFAGGAATLVDALVSRLRELDAIIITAAADARLERAGAGFTVTYTHATDDADAPESVALDADVVIVATDEDVARGLLTGAGATIAGEAWSRPAVTVTLAVDVADSFDIGAGLDTPLEEPAVWAIEDLTAQRGVTGTSRLLRVRLSPVADGLSDDDAVTLATSEASRLLQTRLVVHEHAIARRAAAAPASRMGHADRAKAARAAVRRVSGLGVVGGWLSGSGVSRVIDDASTTAEEVRRTALFG